MSQASAGVTRDKDEESNDLWRRADVHPEFLESVRRLFGNEFERGSARRVESR